MIIRVSGVRDSQDVLRFLWEHDVVRGFIFDCRALDSGVSITEVPFAMVRCVSPGCGSAEAFYVTYENHERYLEDLRHGNAIGRCGLCAARPRVRLACGAGLVLLSGGRGFWDMRFTLERLSAGGIRSSEASPSSES